MPQTQKHEIARCPNPKCNKPIWDDHSYSWCAECGDPLPQNIKAQIPNLQKRAAEAAVAKAGLGISDETAIREVGSIVVPASNVVSTLMGRYRDAYLVARATNGFGGLIKGIAIVIAALLLLIGFLFMGEGHLGDATFALGVITIVSGIVAGVGFYIVGVLVAAQGQILKASLDSAVNNSPFLTNEHKAKIMSLPQP